MDWSLHDLVRSMGLSGTYAGYRYLVYSLELIREDPEKVEMVTKKIYPDVAKRFGVRASRVDGALRTAIQVCWERGDWELTGRRTERERPPSVSAFLRRLARLDREKNGRKQME